VPAHLDDEPGALPLREVAAVAHDHGVPTLVDAAFLNYPPASMRRFTEVGGDLVCFSAKYCYGPNTGGFVVGRSDLVDAVADVERSLHESNPRVAVHRWDDTLIVAVDTMLPEQGPYVCERLRVAFSV